MTSGPSDLHMVVKEPSEAMNGRKPKNHERRWFLGRTYSLLGSAAAAVVAVALMVKITASITTSNTISHLEHQLSQNEIVKRNLPSRSSIFVDGPGSLQRRALQTDEELAVFAFILNLLGIKNSTTSQPPTSNESSTATSTSQDAYATAKPELNEDIVLRLNCGGQAYTDAEGRLWSGDAYFTNGSSGSEWLISWLRGLQDWLVFQTYRAESGLFLWLFSTGRTLLYTLPVPREGEFEVTLHFTNRFFLPWRNRGKFDVNLQGSLALTSKDWESSNEAVTQSVAVSLQTSVSKESKQIDLEFVPNGSEAYVSAIEVRAFAFTSIPLPTPTATDPPVPTPANKFETILINVGGDAVVDFLGRTWIADKYFTGGDIYVDSWKPIADSQDDSLYQTERNGIFSYEIPVPPSISGWDLEIILHFAEIYFDTEGKRMFNIGVEGTRVFSNVDIISIGAGKHMKAVTLETPQTIIDGFVSISFTDAVPKINNPKLSAIEIRQVKDHLAHAVTDGPYSATDSDGDGVEVIQVDGKLSHTHGPGMVLTEFIWQTGSTVLGIGEKAGLTLLVGVHTVTLTVKDSGGNDSTEATTITVYSNAFPTVKVLSPNSGPVMGGTDVTISGSGFTSAAIETKVNFGSSVLTGSAITIVNQETIKVKAPSAALGIPVDVFVETKVGASNTQKYAYVAGSKIEFDEKFLTNFESPTVVRFGPNGKLYVGNPKGQIGVVTLDDNLNVSGMVVSMVSQWRAITGLAFDPLDTSENPDVYFSHSWFYHGEPKSSYKEAINGKVSKARGANLDEVIDIIVGLPVGDHDHGVNGLEFGDQGQLYIQVGGNTNGGLPGQISGSQQLKENVLSAATLVAYLANPAFNGVITYDSDDSGNQVGAKGSVEVYAAGMRNPYGIVLHSNGKLYGTDNGPNLNYGNMKKGCSGQQVEDIEEDDKINLIEKGKYYGHPNPKRAENDPRQCVWRSFEDPSDGSYTAPLLRVASSTDGIVEFKSDAFEGQMRGDLIVSKYNDALFRIILTNGGTATVHQPMKPIELAGGKGLDVTQAPDGSLIESRFSDNQLYAYLPKEAASSALAVKSIFPHRGGNAGGSTLTVYGTNLKKNGGNPSVTVGGSQCIVTSSSDNKIQCTLPGGSGTVDVVVSVNGESYTFASGYRFITGFFDNVRDR